MEIDIKTINIAYVLCTSFIKLTHNGKISPSSCSLACFISEITKRTSIKYGTGDPHRLSGEFPFVSAKYGCHCATVRAACGISTCGNGNEWQGVGLRKHTVRSALLQM
jgi:hypothetical protein